MILLLLFFLVPWCLLGHTAADPVCDAPMDAGTTPCAQNSSLRFYLDPTTKRCLAFQYTGCGGNANGFESISDCHTRCVPMDRLKCPANSTPMKNDKGTTNCGADPMEPSCVDAGAYCQTGAHGNGVCCSKDVKDKVHQDHKKFCANGREKYRMETGGHRHTLLGKSCSTDFCPSGYQCQMGNYYAFCCRK